MNTVISAIVVNYNTGELLRSYVDSLMNCPLEIEIIVMDNASTDGSLDALLGQPCVQIIKSPASVGFAATYNSGARVASAHPLPLLNPHCFFKLGTPVRLLDAMGVEERVGMAGGLLAVSEIGYQRNTIDPWTLRACVKTWRLGLQKAAQHPLVGIGYGGMTHFQKCTRLS